MDSQPCGQPLLCYRSDELDHRIEVYNGRAGAGMAEFRAHRERALSSTTHDFAFLHVRAGRRMILERCQGFEGSKVLTRGLHGRRSSDLAEQGMMHGASRTFSGLTRHSCVREAASQEGRPGQACSARRVKGSMVGCCPGTRGPGAATTYPRLGLRSRVTGRALGEGIR